MTETNDLFEQAARFKVRFDSPKGMLSVEDLWDLPLSSTSASRANLDSIAVALHRATREFGEVVSFVSEKPTAANAELKLKFGVVKHVIDVRVAERDRAKEAADRKDKKDRILELIARKQDEALAGKSIEELTELAKSL